MADLAGTASDDVYARYAARRSSKNVSHMLVPNKKDSGKIV